MNELNWLEELVLSCLVVIYVLKHLEKDQNRHDKTLGYFAKE